MERVLKKFSDKPYLVITLAWLIVQTLLYLKYGIVTELEAKKYVNAANFILEHGTFPERKYLFYALTPLLIAFNIKLGFGLLGSVLCQLLLNFLSTILFYKLCFKLTGSALASIAATLLLLFFIPYQIWNVYLYTESVFLSCIIIFLFFLHKVVQLKIENNLSVLSVVLLVISTLLVITARPFGMLFIPPLLLALLLMLPKRLFPLAIGIAAAGIFILYYSLNRAFSGSVDWNSMVSNVNGHIICDIRDERYASGNLKLLQGGNPVDQLVYYVVNNPKHFIQLSAERLASFFNITRSYYSTGNNIYLIAYMIAVYGLVIAGLKNFYTSIYPFRIFILTAIGFYTFATTLQCDDYHSRFIMALFPLFILIGSFGIRDGLQKASQ